MSTTSPNFNLVLATSADVVSVTSHISNNFSTLDSILNIVHTGTGQLKTGLTLTTPILVNPVLSGSLSGAGVFSASTGSFNTITATGGSVTLNTFNIGTYALPSTIGATGSLLTVVTGNAVFVAPSGGTGANTGLSNLAAVAINTNLNTLTAGFVTVDRVIATSGALTGLTSFQATAGTFAGLLTALGTVTANVINCTGGAITAGGITVGTFALPSTLGANGTIFKATGGTASFYAPIMTTTPAFCAVNTTSINISAAITNFIPANVLYDSVTSYNSASGVYTVSGSGIYEFEASIVLAGSGAAITFLRDATSISLGVTTTAGAGLYTIKYMSAFTSGATAAIVMTGANGATYKSGGYFVGKRIYEF